MHVAPHAQQTRQVWNFIGGAWNRLHSSPAANCAADRLRRPCYAADPDSEAATQRWSCSRCRLDATPAPTRPMPLPAPRPGGLCRPLRADKGFDELLCLRSQSIKRWPTPAARRLQTGLRSRQHVLAAMQGATRALDWATPTRGHRQHRRPPLLLRPVPGHPGVACTWCCRPAAAT